MSPVPWLTPLNKDVVPCTISPRLVISREQVARTKRRAYGKRGKPVPLSHEFVGSVVNERFTFPQAVAARELF